MKKLHLAVLISIVLVSCNEVATFNGPQPANTKDITEFPKSLRAKYVSEGQESVLDISPDRLIRTYDFDLKVHKDSLGANYLLTGNSLKSINTGSIELVNVIGDTVIQHQHWIDTLFVMDAQHVARHFKGYYFLNTQLNDTSWITQKLSLNKGQLTLAGIDNESDIQHLKNLTETDADTVGRHFTLTKKQFRKFVRRDGFHANEHFTRMK